MREKKPFPLWTLVIILACIALWLYAAKLLLDQQRQYMAFRESSAVLSQTRDTYLPGIAVDGIDLGGMTREEASALFESRKQARQQAFSVVVQSGERRWRITEDEVPMSFEITDALEAAFVPGHTGTREERLAEIDRVAREGLSFETGYGIDTSPVAGLVEVIASSLERESVNATLDAFDMDTLTFSYREGESGVRVDRVKLERDILSAIEKEEQDAVVTVETETIPPEITAKDLEGRFGLMSTFTTNTTTDRDRNKNIDISAQALNGQMVSPGETLSFNGCTGKRTYEKGYREAHAIVGGVLVDDTGGGVCQTSSTLFNAVVRADLEIVKRYAHSWPSIYVPKGEDATVNWPNRDFVFRNSSPYPVFIRAWYEDRQVTVEVYGLLPVDYSRIDLFSETIQTIKPSDDVLYTLDESLPLGTRQAGHSKRTGYLVDTYKVYYDIEGNELRREKLWRTDYPATQQEIVYH